MKTEKEPLQKRRYPHDIYEYEYRVQWQPVQSDAWL